MGLPDSRRRCLRSFRDQSHPPSAVQIIQQNTVLFPAPTAPAPGFRSARANGKRKLTGHESTTFIGGNPSAKGDLRWHQFGTIARGRIRFVPVLDLIAEIRGRKTPQSKSRNRENRIQEGRRMESIPHRNCPQYAVDPVDATRVGSIHTKIETRPNFERLNG